MDYMALILHCLDTYWYTIHITVVVTQCIDSKTATLMYVHAIMVSYCAVLQRHCIGHVLEWPACTVPLTMHCHGTDMKHVMVGS